MDILRISLIQTDIRWEDKPGNLIETERILTQLKGKTDLVVLPEMFTTGFSMNSAELAESNYGTTVSTLREWAQSFDFALTGSFIAGEGGKFYNRGFFITPENAWFYDKRHLFRMSNEGEHFHAGNAPLTVFYKGWNISLQICYDLRFPVWCRNVNNAYDLMVVTASWPAVRQHPWEILLQARAIENQAYVAGVNRVGTDPTGTYYKGGSLVADMKGNVIAKAPDADPYVLTVELSAEKLHSFRKKFPAWMDADSFELIP